MTEYNPIMVKKETKTELTAKKDGTWDAFLLSLLHGKKPTSPQPVQPVRKVETKGICMDSLLLDFEEFSNDYIRKHPSSLIDMKAVREWLNGKV